MRLILSVLLLAASCAAPGRRDANLPSWATRDSGVFKDEAGAWAFYGRGVAAEVRVPELGRSISRERAREDVLVIVTAVMAEHTKNYLDANYGRADAARGPAAVSAMQDFLKLVVNNEEVAATYATPDARRYYALVKLDLGLVKRKLSEAAALDAGLRDYLLARLDDSSSLKLNLHRELSEKDEPVVQALPAANDIAAPTEWDPTGRNAVLYHADLGLALHYAGRYEESAKELAAAEERSRELAALAVSRSSATTYFDEGDADYAADPAEQKVLALVRDLDTAFLGSPVSVPWLLTAAPPAADSGEVVFVHYNGAAPRKVAERWNATAREGLAAIERVKRDGDPVVFKSRVPQALNAGFSVSSITVAGPRYEPPSFAVASSEIRTGALKAASALVENTAAALARDLAERNAAARTRRVAYAMIRHLLARLNDSDASVKYGPGSWQYLLTLKTTDATRSTPTADLRAPRELPAQIRVARLALAPGVYELTASFKDAAGKEVSTQTYKGVSVVAGRRTFLNARTVR